MLDAGLFIGKESLDYFKALIIALAKLKEIEQLDCKFNFLNLRRHLDFRLKLFHLFKLSRHVGLLSMSGLSSLYPLVKLYEVPNVFNWLFWVDLRFWDVLNFLPFLFISSKS